MKLTITYSLDEASLAKFLAHVRRFEQKADNPTRSSNAAYKAMLDEAEALMRNRWRTNFTSGGSIYGPWAPLDPDTVRAKGGRGAPLVTTGRMRSKFFSSMYGQKKAQGVEWTFRNYRGLLYHHFGTTSGGGQEFANKYGGAPYVGFANMHEPPRRLVGMNATDRGLVREIVREHAKKFVSLAWTGSQQG